MTTNEDLKRLREGIPQTHGYASYTWTTLILRAGYEGTVTRVDDTGTIHVRWDCCSSLGVVYDIDKCERI